MNLFKRFANTFDKHGVPIENDGNGDMKKSAYDADGSVAEAGGIASYVESHGSGLPDPSSYDDGTVLVKVGSEWKAQSGYGYEGAPAFEPIEWDGNTEGHDVLAEAYYKISESSPTSTALVGAEYVVHTDSGDVNGFVSASDIEEVVDGFLSVMLPSGHGIYIFEHDVEIEDLSAHKGTYFSLDSGEYVSSLTAPSSVTTIDQKFIPQSGGGVMVVNFTIGDSVSSDKTIDEIKSFNGIVEGKASDEYMQLRFIFNGEMFTYSQIIGTTLNTYCISYENDAWQLASGTYTLTPASEDQQPG